MTTTLISIYWVVLTNQCRRWYLSIFDTVQRKRKSPFFWNGLLWFIWQAWQHQGKKV